jgi:Phosphodiester glycosidase
MRGNYLTYLLPLLLVGCNEAMPVRDRAESPSPDTSPISATAPVAKPNPAPVAKPTASPTAKPLTVPKAAAVSYTTQSVGNSLVHILTVRSGIVKPVIASDLQTVGQLAKSSGAIAAINGGFFDPNNQQTTSYVVMSQKTVADPKQNSQLTENPKLKQYLRQIFDRSEFRRYDCAGKPRYVIENHTKPAPEGCQMVDAIGGGPQLLPDLQAQREGFTDPELGRDAIGSQVANARSAIGITKDNGILLVMVAQQQPKSGMTLAELAALMKSLGAESAMNLDGGSSSAMVYENKSMIGMVNAEGDRSDRAVKSAIVVVGQ